MPTRLVAGLGNPGPKYAQTRHNVGFMVVDLFAERKGLKLTRQGFKAVYGEARLGQDRIVFLKPQTFMNLSGESVAAAAHWYKVQPEDMIVIYDDLDLPTGRVRIRERGSAGGHNGMKSIIQHLGTENYPRIRLGIGRPLPGWTVENWVLSAFTPEEQTAITEGIARAADALEMALRHGVPRAASQYSS